MQAGNHRRSSRGVRCDNGPTGADIDARYHTDMAGVPVAPPLAVVRPRTTEDVSQFLKLCHQAHVPVTTQGGMTGLVRADDAGAGAKSCCRRSA